MEDTYDYDYVVVGAGPAGVQMAYFLQKSGRKYVVFEAQDKAGSFFAVNPRNRRLLSINKKNNKFKEETFNMRHDWNSLISDNKDLKFPPYSDRLYPDPSSLNQYINDFASTLKLNIQYNTKVEKLSKPGPGFKVSTQKKGDDMMQTCTARCVLMANGALSENIPSTIEGINLAESYATYDLDKKKYTNQRVLVIGGGNSSFETADLISRSAGILHVTFNKKINFAWNTHYVGDLRAVSNKVLDLYQLKSMVATLGYTVTKIRKNEEGKFVVTFRDLVTHHEVPGWVYFEMTYDTVITCMGWNYIKPEMFDDTINLETVKNGRYAKLSSCWESTTENLFYIGTTMAAIDKKSASGFIHGFRYNIRTLQKLLEHRHFDTPLPHTQIKSNDLQAISDHIIERFSLTDALYQMNTFLCDVMIIDDSGTKYYNEFPINHVMNIPEFKTAKHAFVLYFAYGFDDYPKSFEGIDHIHGPAFYSNRCVAFLHPIIEYHSYGRYQEQTQMHESLTVRWDWSGNKAFPSWIPPVSSNYIGFFINDKVKWTDKEFNLSAVPGHMLAKRYKVLNVEQMKRIPPVLEPAKCYQGEDLLPEDQPVKRERVLRPTREEMMQSACVPKQTGGEMSALLKRGKITEDKMIMR